MIHSENGILMAKGEKPAYLLPQMSNRHGLVSGATGTGKTTTLKVMAESFSDAGVPVFLADVKGDLASLAEPGSMNPKLKERLVSVGIDDFTFSSYPVCFWDLFGESGHKVRTTVSEMGAFLLSRLLDLNDTQTGVLNMVFRIADDRGMLLLDLKDLRSMLQYTAERSREFMLDYGNINSQSAGAILRKLMALEDQGGSSFFGEPALDIYDWIRTSADGRGYINILHSSKLFHTPSMYSTFLLWMLSELFEELPEAGDTAKPKMVFFFDEAHLLFKNAPRVLLEKAEQVIRLIRSKGVAVFFISQYPADLPPEILGQLGNRIQHALRAYTPKDQTLVRAAAQTFRSNPSFDTVTAVTELGTGEALLSFLDKNGRPGIVERALILPPRSKFGTISDELRKKIIMESPMNGKYDRSIDRESAYEMLKFKAMQEQESAKLETEREEMRKKMEQEARESAKLYKKTVPRNTRAGGFDLGRTFEKTTSSLANTIGRELGRSIIRGLLGSLRR